MGSYTRLTYHIVFGSKFRRKSIQNEIVEPVYEYIGGIIRNRKGTLIQVGGTEDHLHLLVGLPPTTPFPTQCVTSKLMPLNGLMKIERAQKTQVTGSNGKLDSERLL